MTNEFKKGQIKIGVRERERGGCILKDWFKTIFLLFLT
jgi:hypothetical protein